MNLHPAWRAAAPAALLWLLLLAPPVQHRLQTSMNAQMLLQMPLLVLVGWLLAAALPPALLRAVARWDQHGISSVVLASFVSAYWMLPRTLDASVTQTLIAAAKFVSLPLLVGLPLALAWPRMAFIVKGVFVLEFIATVFRLGWLYLISPERLCNNYLLDDQQRLGQNLLWIGAALCAAVAAQLLWGRFDLRTEGGAAAAPPQA